MLNQLLSFWWLPPLLFVTAAFSWIVACICCGWKYQDEINRVKVAEYNRGHDAGNTEGFNNGETSGYFQGVRAAVAEMRREVGVRESAIMSRN